MFGGVVDKKDVVIENIMVKERGVVEEKIKIDWKNIDGVVKNYCVYCRCIWYEKMNLNKIYLSICYWFF